MKAPTPSSTRQGVAREADVYLPAYLRRYPFVLARLREDSDELSLCFDPTSGAVGEFDEGEPLFDGEEPSEATKAILQFCEQFEQAGQRTQAFMNEIKESGPVDGRRSRDPAGRIASSHSSTEASRWSTRRSSATCVATSCANSTRTAPCRSSWRISSRLSVIREIFGRQVQQGTGPVTAPQPATADA